MHHNGVSLVVLPTQQTIHEAAARRELQEECGDVEVNAMQYVGSAKIDD